MKKIIISFVFLLLFSCNKENEATIQEQIQSLPQTTFTIRDDGTRPMNNIQSGERIALEVKIKNMNTGVGVKYQLKPVTTSLVKHQLINTDYLLQIKNADGSYSNVTSLTIDTPISYLYILVLRPGTFQHEYTLQKFVDNIPSPEILSEKLIFSAVRFYFWFPTVETRSAGLFNHSVQRRDYYIGFDDGQEQYDNYFTATPDKSLFYESNYEGDYRSGNFSSGNWYELRGFKEQESSDPPITTWSINQVKVSQTFTSGSATNNIIYNNVNIN